MGASKRPYYRIVVGKRVMPHDYSSKEAARYYSQDMRTKKKIKFRKGYRDKYGMWIWS